MDSSASYHYFYNEEFIDPNYKESVPGIPFKFGWFFNQAPSRVSRKVREIVSENKILFNEKDELVVTVDLSVDTVNCAIKNIQTNLGISQNARSLDKKIKRYFFSLSPIDCFRNPYNSKLIEAYAVIIEYNKQTKEIVVSCEPGESLIAH